nr:uncharacterized mitochondrial protein AtMg00810-like [Tanacetum cinerariifolium]
GTRLERVLGLQVKQKKDGIFISQDKYVAEILKKIGLSEEKSVSTPIDAEKPLNDLDSVSLDDLYNHLKVYEAKVQKKPNSNPQDMAFISSSKNSNNEDGNTALTNLKLSDSIVTIWVTSQESAEHQEIRKEMGLELQANEEDHALVADEETLTEFALIANNENKVFDNSLCSKEYRKNTESLNNKIDELKNDLYEANIYRHS